MPSFQKAIEPFIHLIAIWVKHHLSISQRWCLFSTYLRILGKRVVHQRICNFDNKTTLITDYRVYAESFYAMYKTFVEVFVDEQYYFSTVNDSPRIIDGGANIGLATLYFKWRFPKASIVAFEPHPVTARLLSKNIIENHLEDVSVVEAALSDRLGQISLHGECRTATTMPNGLWNKQVPGPDCPDGDIIVNTAPLSDYVDRKTDLLKLDVEGAEGVVLKELAEARRLTFVGKVVLEYHYRDLGKNSLAEIIQCLERAGFMTTFIATQRSQPIIPNYTQFVISAEPRTGKSVDGGSLDRSQVRS